MTGQPEPERVVDTDALLFVASGSSTPRRTRQALATVMAIVAGLAAAWVLGWHLYWQISRLDIDDPESCLALFRKNRDGGLLAALFLAVAGFL